MGKLEKFLTRLFSHPIPVDIKYSEAKKFLESIGCIAVKRKGTSHRVFKHPEYKENITLMEPECLRRYQVDDIKKLVLYLGIVEEENE